MKLTKEFTKDVCVNKLLVKIDKRLVKIDKLPIKLAKTIKFTKSMKTIGILCDKCNTRLTTLRDKSNMRLTTLRVMNTTS